MGPTKKKSEYLGLLLKNSYEFQDSLKRTLNQV